MQHPRLSSRIAALGAAVALVCGVPGAADARSEGAPVVAAEKDTVDLVNKDLEDALLAEINRARTAQGLSTIRSLDVCTDALAEQWGNRIARTGRFEHRDQGEVIRKCNNSWAGETLVRGTDLAPVDMVELWLDSPGHREILLSRRARLAGIAITRDAQGRTIGVVNLVRR